MTAARILLVDDQPAQRKEYERRLVKEGLHVDTAGSGREAIDRLGPEHRYHLVISDLNMPNSDVSGLDLVRHIRSTVRLSMLPVLVFTSSDSQEDVNVNLQAGASDYVVKNRNHEEFIARVRNLARNGQLQEELERVSRTDALTQLSNRRHGTQRLEEEMNRSRRYGRGLAVAIMDVDHFKKVNDTHGHQAGDEVLVTVAQQLQDASRTSDCVIRWGGEEFLIVLPETRLRDAARLVERMRSQLASRCVPVLGGSRQLVVTMSGGVAELEADDSLESFIARADTALYRAKQTGRNRLLMAESGELLPVGA